MSFDVRPARFLRRHADQLGVLAGLVAHVQHADRTRLDPHARVHRIFEQHQRIERVAVTGERVGHESVVGRIGGGREQPTVEEHPTALVIDLVLVPAPTWDLDDDEDATVGWGLLLIGASFHTDQTSDVA